MNQEFTEDEIKDASRIARIYCPGFSEEKFKSLMELERRMADSGFLEAVQGLLRLEEEQGIACTEALDTYKELLQQKRELEQEEPGLEKRVESLITQIKRANVDYEQVKTATAKAAQELVQIRDECNMAEKKLQAFNKRTEKEKQCIEKEVQDCYQQANVTREEVVTAGQIKVEVESYGFTLDLVLELSKEFAGHKNAREKLATGLKEYGSFTRYLDNLADWGNKERARVMLEIAGLESQKTILSGESSNLRNLLSQLQADITSEEALRRFHRRYAGLSGLMDQLTTWDQVYFVRCGNPVNTVAGVLDKKQGNPHFWTDRAPVMCPHCGYRQLFSDTEVYQYLNWPAERPLKLTLGE